MAFYYDEQIKKYLVQFVSIFTDFEVKVGKTDKREEALIPVPVHYGSKDRVAAAILADNTQNKPIRVPVMSTYISGLELAPDRRKGVGQGDRHSHLPRGGLIPDDITTVHRLMPVPYNMNVELSIFTSNQDQHMQLMEQILMLFDPSIEIQKNDSAFDWTRLFKVELQGIRFDENYPMGVDRRVIQTTLDFLVPIYISPPSQLKQDFVEKIKMRITAVDYADNVPGDIIAEFDAQGVDYDTVISSDDLENIE